jgi:hypothetical protein
LIWIRIFSFPHSLLFSPSLILDCWINLIVQNLNWE